MNWSGLALGIVAAILALGIITSWTILIVTGHVGDVPPVFGDLLTGLTIGGVIGAAQHQVIQGK